MVQGGQTGRAVLPQGGRRFPPAGPALICSSLIFCASVVSACASASSSRALLAKASERLVGSGAGRSVGAASGAVGARARPGTRAPGRRGTDGPGRHGEIDGAGGAGGRPRRDRGASAAWRACTARRATSSGRGPVGGGGARVPGHQRVCGGGGVAGCPRCARPGGRGPGAGAGAGAGADPCAGLHDGHCEAGGAFWGGAVAARALRSSLTRSLRKTGHRMKSRHGTPRLS